MRWNRHRGTHAPFVRLLIGLTILTAGCNSPEATPPADSQAVAAVIADSLDRVEQQEAVALADSARVTLASLLTDPTTAAFDSLVVVRPPSGEEGRLAPLAVCGSIRGRPEMGGRATATRFVYQTKWAVFVEESGNLQAFADLMGRTCGAAGVRVVLR